jgi:DNA mismatch repair protein MutS2
VIGRRTLDDLGWPTLVDHWAKRCATKRGETAVRAEPMFGEIAAARQRVAEISEARGLASRDAKLPLGGIVDIAGAIERVRKAAALEAAELVAVASTGRALARLRTHLREHAEVAPKLAVHAGALADLGHVFHPILDAFDADGRLVDHASDELGPLRRAAASIKAQLEKRMDGMLTDERFAGYLQDAYYTQREDRYVLPVRTDGKGFVRGIVHATSQSGQTLFIEPEEIVDLNNRLKLAEAEVVAEEHRIFIKFSGWIAEEADGFTASLAAAETLDVIAAAAIMADDTISAEPILDETPRIALLHARHPLMLLAERRCVANDVTVAAGQTLLVSGPNAGGKTVALKTVGLAAVMARAGLHLTAESGSAIGWFHDIVTDIGDAQNLEKDLSTFSGHMVNLRELMRAAAPGMLVLIDEIAVGTDPDQGAALAQAVLEALANRGVTGIVTTHYDRLKSLGSSDAHFANASVGFDLERLEPTFKLHLGTPGSSGALAVATRMGLDRGVVERARELVGVQGTRVEELLANVADQRRRMEEERAALLAELEAVEAERATLKMHRDRTAARFEKQARAAHGEALSALRNARREIDEVRKQIRAAATPDDVRAATRKLVAPGAAVAQHEPKRKLPPGTPATVESLVVGAPVIVPKLGRCEVVSPPHDGKVEVRLGQMRALVAIDDVLMDSHRAARAAERERDNAPPPDKQEPGVVLVDGVPAGGRATARTIDSTVDVRGQRVEEAVAIVDRFLDESLLANRDTAFVVHGHGTGALRSAIRTHLATHQGITTFRAGEPNEGGDGVTVAFLKG